MGKHLAPMGVVSLVAADRQDLNAFSQRQPVSARVELHGISYETLTFGICLKTN